MPKPAIPLEVWIDDPPRLVLTDPYLERLHELPLTGVAVMLDGPAPGLSDARWSARDLEALARALPDHDRVLTAWASANARAIAELARKLPELLEALAAIAMEMDVEPIGEWRESGVHGIADRDLDGARLDDAAADLAEVLVSLPVCEIESTTFPGALRVLLPLLEELVARARPDQVIRVPLQVYPVRTRGKHEIPFAGPLGPVRFPREALDEARGRVPDGVEVFAALAAYDTVFPGHGDTMVTAAESAVLGGSRRLRWWSSKWLCRKGGHARRRRELVKIAAMLEALRPTPPAPAPDLLTSSVLALEEVAAGLKDAYPSKAADVARCAQRLVE